MRLLFIYILCIVTAGLVNAQDANVIGEGFTKHEITINKVWSDPEHNLTLDQVRNEINGKSDELSGDIDSYWLSFDLVNKTGRDATWYLNFDKWTEVSLYENNSSEAKHTGHLIPFNKKDIPFTNYNLIKVEIAAGETIQYTAYLEKSIKHYVVPTEFNIQLIEKTTFYSIQMRKRLLLGLFLGFYLIMLAYNFFIYVSTRDHYYVYYLIILFTLLLLTLHNSGYTFELFGGFDFYCHLNAKVQFVLSAVLGVNIILFAQQFLNLKETFPKTSKLLKVLMILVILMPIPSFLGNALVNDAISGLLGTLVMIVIMVTAIRAAIAKLPSSRYFAYGYGAFSLGIIALLLSFMGVLPIEVLDYYPMNIGSSIEMIFFSLALGNRINLLSKDNEAKQLEIIESLKANEELQGEIIKQLKANDSLQGEIIKQLKANEELQTKVNRELEQKVRERTKEIEHQKVKIEEQRDLITIEKRKSDELILNILPESTAEELKQTGKATPKFYKKATVIFTDIVSFTQKTVELEVSEIVKELDYCFCAFDDIMKRNGIEKIKTIGDGYMGVGGIPVENDTHPQDAIKAGLEIIAFMEEFGKKREAQGQKPWGIRVGIHTGSLISGVVGKDKFAYDVWGDTVNMASRMESSGESGRVNVSDITYQACKNDFEFTHRGKILAKHKGEIDMYFVDGIIVK